MVGGGGEAPVPAFSLTPFSQEGINRWDETAREEAKGPSFDGTDFKQPPKIGVRWVMEVPRLQKPVSSSPNP